MAIGRRYRVRWGRHPAAPSREAQAWPDPVPGIGERCTSEIATVQSRAEASRRVISILVRYLNNLENCGQALCSFPLAILLKQVSKEGSYILIVGIL